MQELAKQHKNPTTCQGMALSEQHSVLKEKLQNWLVLRVIYIPGLVQYLTEIGEPCSDADKPPENVRLPSSLPSDQRRSICMEGLPCIEEKLHTAQCHDALNGIHHTLHLKTRMIHFHNKNT